MSLFSKDDPLNLSAKIKLTPFPLSSLNAGRLSRLAASVQTAPRHNGAIDQGSPALVGTAVPDYMPSKLLNSLLLARKSVSKSILYAWTDFPILPTVTFTTFFADSPPLRIVFPPGSRVITPEEREFIWVFFRQSKAIGAVRVVLTDPLLDSYLGDVFRVLDQPANPILSDFAAIWLVGRIESLNKALNTQERLQLSWANSYFDALSKVPDPEVIESLPRDFGSLSPFLQELLYHAMDTGFSGPLMYDWLATRGSLFKGLADIRVSMADFMEFCHARTDHRHCGLLHLLESLILLDPRLTDFGLKIPYVGFDGELSQLPINAGALSDRGILDDYWSRFPETLIFRLGNVAGENDALCNLGRNSPIWAQMPKTANPEECWEAAKSLLEEAVAHRQWTIPPKAIVQLTLGPFIEFEVTEMALDGFTEVHFVGKTASGEIFPIVIEPAAGFIGIYYSDDHVAPFSDIKAALFLPLAAVLRDFWVAEQREAVFSAKSRTSGTPRLSGNPAEERIVYLPRIRYSEKANLGRLTQDLPVLPRSAHQVREHTRKVNNPNPNQVALAALFNVRVPIGYTFVRPHQRGVAETTIRYRSRSALRCLYEEVDPGTSSGSANWFLFEKKVKDWLTSLGYEAIHTSAARNGDHGVDVSASWKSGGTERLLVAQCKCYSADRPVGPSVVRELVGALAACPAGTQGIIATTSYATDGAQALASEHNILIVTGEDWVITDGNLSRVNESLGDAGR